MPDTQVHYDELLGPVYSWMTGDFTAACARSEVLFDRLGLEPTGRQPAVDLGCGHGVAAVPLAARGFDVVAIDFCRALLNELDAVRGELRIRTVEADLLDFRRHVEARAAAVVCLGDTLPHLPDVDAVERLVGDVAAALAPGGTFVATFRDYVSRELEGEARFIPVKSDADRILTCVLEYTPESVLVHDLLHVRGPQGWHQHVSSYRKLRLDPKRLSEFAAAAGLSVRECAASDGLVTFAASRPRA